MLQYTSKSIKKSVIQYEQSLEQIESTVTNMNNKIKIMFLKFCFCLIALLSSPKTIRSRVFSAGTIRKEWPEIMKKGELGF